MKKARIRELLTKEKIICGPGQLFFEEKQGFYHADCLFFL